MCLDYISKNLLLKIKTSKFLEDSLEKSHIQCEFFMATRVEIPTPRVEIPTPSERHAALRPLLAPLPSLCRD